jgi:hypothetical protein
VIEDIRNDRRSYTVRRRLATPEGRPRQIDMGDVHDAEERMTGRRQEVDLWLERAREANDRGQLEHYLNGDAKARSDARVEDARLAQFRQWNQDCARAPSQGYKRCAEHGQIVGYCPLCEMKKQRVKRLADGGFQLPSGARMYGRPR